MSSNTSFDDKGWFAIVIVALIIGVAALFGSCCPMSDGAIGTIVVIGFVWFVIHTSNKVKRKRKEKAERAIERLHKAKQDGDTFVESINQKILEDIARGKD